MVKIDVLDLNNSSLIDLSDRQSEEVVGGVAAGLAAGAIGGAIAGGVSFAQGNSAGQILTDSALGAAAAGIPTAAGTLAYGAIVPPISVPGAALAG
jgi:hypothetical protein